MPDAPVPLPCRHRLRNGATVTLRPIRHEDAALERAFIGALSDESRYLRFQKWVGGPTDRLIQFLTDVDAERHLALACTHEGPAGEELVGEARYVKNPDGVSCEFGIMVADAWRKSGIAGLLMDALIRTARGRGLERMEGLVLRTNRPMLRFSRALGFRLDPIPEDPTVIRVVKPLGTAARGEEA